MNKSKLTLIAVCAGMAAAFGQTMTSSQIGQKIKQLSGAPVDYKVAGEWFKLSQMTDNVSLKQEILMDEVGASLYAKKLEIYQNVTWSL